MKHILRRKLYCFVCWCFNNNTLVLKCFNSYSYSYLKYNSYKNISKNLLRTMKVIIFLKCITIDGTQMVEAILPVKVSVIRGAIDPCCQWPAKDRTNIYAKNGYHVWKKILQGLPQLDISEKYNFKANEQINRLSSAILSLKKKTYPQNT